jgi:hypothetical protein
MGLSDEERYAHIVHSICHINDKSENLSHYTTKPLKNLVSQLWYEFLRRDSNGAFWLMGGDLHNDYLESETLAGVAFKCHVPQKPEPQREYDDYERYKTLKGFFDMDRLLSQEDAAVLLIYMHTQNICYALCRYPDKFLDKYEDLNRLVRAIQGECFKLMKTHYEYAYAWMVHNLCDRIYNMNDDIVNKWWSKECLSHHVKLEYGKYKDIYEAYVKYQWKDLTVQDRITLTLLLLKYSYAEHEHCHKAFMKMVEEYNDANEVKINVEEIENHYKKVKARNAKPYYRSCEFTGNYIGHDGKVDNIYKV